MKKPKIFIACDTTNLSKVKSIISQTNTSKIKIGYKFGLELMNSKKGRQFVSTLKNKIIFIDALLSEKVISNVFNKKELEKVIDPSNYLGAAPAMAQRLLNNR